MNKVINKDGITLNGRRFNSPKMQQHIGVPCTVEQLNANTVRLWLEEEHGITATAQSAISLDDIEPQINDRVMIIAGVARGKNGFIWGIDDCEFLIIADDDDDYPHGYQRDEFIVLSAECNHAN